MKVSNNHQLINYINTFKALFASSVDENSMKANPFTCLFLNLGMLVVIVTWNIIVTHERDQLCTWYKSHHHISWRWSSVPREWYPVRDFPIQLHTCVWMGITMHARICKWLAKPWEIVLLKHLEKKLLLILFQILNRDFKDNYQFQDWFIITLLHIYAVQALLSVQYA